MNSPFFKGARTKSGAGWLHRPGRHARESTAKIVVTQRLERQRVEFDRRAVFPQNKQLAVEDQRRGVGKVAILALDSGVVREGIAIAAESVA